MNKQAIIERYNEYCQNEFGDTQEISNNIFDLMYTTLPEHEDEIQISYDLSKEVFIVKLKTENHDYFYYEPLLEEEFYTNLKLWNFDMYYSYAHEIVETVFNLELEF